MIWIVFKVDLNKSLGSGTTIPICKYAYDLMPLQNPSFFHQQEYQVSGATHFKWLKQFANK